MPKADALFYFKDISYNHQEYTKKTPVKVSYLNDRYFGYLLNTNSPYKILLTQKLQEGSAKQIPPVEITVENLEQVDYFYHHSH
jgi:hypothetical protein